MTAGADPITFWFDFHSPWSYLAAVRLPAVAARHGRAVRWVPVHVARLIQGIGGRQPLNENPAFVRWYQQDLQDWAALAGLEVRYHPCFPLRPARALRAACHAVDAGAGPDFIQGVMRAYWTLSLDISDPAVLAGIGAGARLDPDAVVAATASPALKARVDDATAAAAEGRGVRRAELPVRRQAVFRERPDRLAGPPSQPGLTCSGFAPAPASAMQPSFP